MLTNCMAGAIMKLQVNSELLKSLLLVMQAKLEHRAEYGLEATMHLALFGRCKVLSKWC